MEHQTVACSSYHTIQTRLAGLEALLISLKPAKLADRSQSAHRSGRPSGDSDALPRMTARKDSRS
jgi:hypothetical protein